MTTTYITIERLEVAFGIAEGMTAEQFASRTCSLEDKNGYQSCPICHFRLSTKKILQEMPVETCLWTQQDDEDSNNWESSCGDIFFFEDGTPEENGMKFCPFCGQPLLCKPYEPEPEEE